jgi:glycogen operon protein
VFLNGQTLRAPDRHGERIVDDSFLVILSASDTDLSWTLPSEGWGRRWTVTLDSADPTVDEEAGAFLAASDTLKIPSRSMLVLRAVDAQRR